MFKKIISWLIAIIFGISGAYILVRKKHEKEKALEPKQEHKNQSIVDTFDDGGLTR